MYIDRVWLAITLFVFLLAGLCAAMYIGGDRHGASSVQLSAMKRTLDAQGKVFHSKVVLVLCGKKGGTAQTTLTVFGPYAVQCADGRVYLPAFQIKKI